MGSQSETVRTTITGTTLPLRTLMGIVLSTLVMTTAPASAQEDAWSTYEDAVDAAERGEHDQALARYRLAERLVKERKLARAICYGSAVVAEKLVEARPAQGRALACEGVEWFDCYLKTGAVEDAEVHRIATTGRARLAAICMPEAPVDRTTAWLLTGGASVALTAGAALILGAVGDADEIRADKDALAERGGATLAEASAVESDESSAALRYALGFGGVGLGALLGAFALHQWVGATPQEVATRVSVGPQGLEVRW